MKRMWVNQPSSLQQHHNLHGVRVLLAESESKFQHTVKIYFVDGPVVSQEIALNALANGWPGTEEHKGPHWHPTLDMYAGR